MFDLLTLRKLSRWELRRYFKYRLNQTVEVDDKEDLETIDSCEGTVKSYNTFKDIYIDNI